jgi:hypothetical protein
MSGNSRHGHNWLALFTLRNLTENPDEAVAPTRHGIDAAFAPVAQICADVHGIFDPVAAGHGHADA